MKSIQETPSGPRQAAAKVDDASSPSQRFEHMVATYLSSNPFVAGAVHQTKFVPELELRFGAGNHPLMRPISKIDYSRVVQALYSAGFAPDAHGPDGLCILRAQAGYTDTRTNQYKISNVRAEIVGVDLIQEYCRTNSLQKLLSMPAQTQAKAEKIKFTEKMSATYKTDSREGPRNYVKPVEFPDFGFRVSYQTESYYSPTSDKGRRIIADWPDAKKTFRYLNRVRFAHPTLPIFADISIVKKSKTTGKVPVPQYTVQDAGVFTNPETYEIELEVDNQRAGSHTLPQLMVHLRKCIRLVLGALQETRFPIGFAETRQVLAGYLKLIHQDNPVPKSETGKMERQVDADATADEDVANILDDRNVKYRLPRFFVGPSSLTLQVDHIVPLSVESTHVPNIRNHYTVTDKADGERRLLYVASSGRVYMITPTLNVIFTGAMATKRSHTSSSEKGKDADVYETLLDGEYITYDKLGQPLHSYMAFDMYFLQGKSVRKEGFYPINVEERQQGNFRFLYLEKYLQAIALNSVMTDVTTSPTTTSPTSPTSPTAAAAVAASSELDRLCGFDLQKKNFYVASGDSEESIFESCQLLLGKVEEGLFPYNTDGIIFTPASMGVGADRIGVTSRPVKDTWEHSFKWKPPRFNTIDFLVKVQHDKRGQEEIKYLYERGQNMQDNAMTLPQYKTLILNCGFDPKKHGYVNPCNDVLHDRISSSSSGGRGEDDDKYKPVIFQPTDPYDANAGFSHVLLRDGVMMSEEGEPFETNMIVEFKYDMEREGAWKWVPLRVRYDKTAELRAGQKNYGNSYHVANSNWSSIHRPVTQDMLTTGKDIPTPSSIQNDVYYNRKTRDTNTQALRNFHNLYVKRTLIVGVSNPKAQLIDFACGKAGDLSKWRAAKLRFVLGVDLSRDNIQNKLDGACARYLKECSKYGEHNMPKCLFFAGDSGKNIRTTGDAFTSATERGYVKAIFGQGNKDPTDLPPAVFNRYGTGETGFDVGSCQFAIHYFFENELTLHSFLRNVSDCIRVGGYFIGTTYDGKTLFDQLRNKPKGGAWTLMKNDTKIAEITKDYDGDEFPDTNQSIGYQIQVFQETINQVFPEYLVNFNYFTQLMDEYGFQLVSNEDAHHIGLPASTGMFEDLYKKMMHECSGGGGRRLSKNEYGTAADMSEDEKKISFLNRYFAFKKMRTVNTENLYKIIHNRATIELQHQTAETQAIPVSTANATATATTTTVIIRTKKLKNKLTIPCTKTMTTIVEPEKLVEESKEPVGESNEPEKRVEEEEPKTTIIIRRTKPKTKKI